MSRPSEVISEGDLLAHVWDENANPYTKTVRVTIATLRRKLAGPGQAQPIETVIGSGYRLNG
jgi:DNA-binding response OmpR family regulator